MEDTPEITNQKEPSDTIDSSIDTDNVSPNDIEIYKELVSRTANGTSSEILPNAGKIHAGIVFAQLFEKTKSIARMIVGNFDGKISNQSIYLDALRKSIDSEVAFQVLLFEKPKAESKAFDLLQLKKAENKSISIAYATEAIKQRLSKKGKMIHFSVFDDNKYRLEKDTNKYLAWVSFNDKPGSQVLIKLFDEIFGQSAQQPTI